MLTTRRGGSLKKDDDVIAKVSTVSIKNTTSDTKIGLTMRADGLGVPRWDSDKKEIVKEVKKKKKEEKAGGSK
jgi:DNA-directed RNA polymerase subunit E'/Rpb7